MKPTFANRLLRWFDPHGRHDLPWQHPREPYRIWLAEVMLQQTQVSTVIPYFERFVARFPNLSSLAAASQDQVLALWAGLGYYARARNLHRCAQLVVMQYGGQFPRELDAVEALPGIGRSTAGAILAQAFGQRHAILDGNVRRVLARHGGVEGWSGAPAVQKKLWARSEQVLPKLRLADYTQAIMDLGATLCTARQPRCTDCPLRADCRAHASGRTAHIPAPRPRRARPHKTTRMLVLRNARGEVLLQRRPQQGIWGGLWCLPELPADAPLPARAKLLPVIEHGFTHFDLSIQPLRLKAARAPAGETRWIKLSPALPVGVPTPVKKILEAL